MENEVLSDNFSIEDSGDEILILSIDIGDGRRDQIKVHHKSNPDQLALEFCSKHRLGAKAKILLTDEIEKNYAKALLVSRASTKATSATNNSANSRSNSTAGETTEIISKKGEAVDLRGNIVGSGVLKRGEAEKDGKGKGSGFIISHKKSFSNLVNPVDRNTRNLSPYMLKRINSTGQAVEKPKNSGKPLKKSTEISSKEKRDASSKALKASPKIADYLTPKITDYLTPNKQEQPGKAASALKDQSERILKKIKRKRFKEIFSMLNPDNKGLISESTIIKASPAFSKVFSILSPLIEEIKQLDEKLNFEEFCDAMELLMKVLNPGEKSVVLNTAKPKQAAVEKCLFKPKINQKQGSFSILNLYERGIQKKKETWKHIMHEQEEKAKLEMKECIFRPNLSSNHRKSRSNADQSNPYINQLN